MIVLRGEANTWRLIEQPDHAAMAGRLAEAWARPASIDPAIWPRLIEAIARHDAGWCEAERAPAVDAHGRPHSFKTLPLPAHIAIWRRGVKQLMRRDPYAGLIVALHARWLYTDLMHPTDRDDAARVQALLDELDQQIDLAIGGLQAAGEAERAAVQPRALMTARRLASALDGLSLQLCGALPAGELPGPLAFGERAAPLRLAAQGERMTVTPWPFAQDAVTLTLPARDIPDVAYDDGAALAAALREATPMTLRYRLAPA